MAAADRRDKGRASVFLLMCLAIYAYKCGVSKQQLRQDMKEAFDDLQMVKHENALTEEDIRSALEAYDKEYYNFTISDIEALTDVRIERNKRNGRSQKEHLKRARAVQEVDYPGGTWRRKGQKKRKRKSMRGGRSIQRDARPIVIGTPDLIRKRSANGGTPYRRGI